MTVVDAKGLAFLFLFLFALVAVACGPGVDEIPVDHPHFDLAASANVKKGMTRAELTTTMGRPHRTFLSATQPCSEVWYWVNEVSPNETQKFVVALDANGVCGAQMLKQGERYGPNGSWSANTAK